MNTQQFSRETVIDSKVRRSSSAAFIATLQSRAKSAAAIASARARLQAQALGSKEKAAAEEPYYGAWACEEPILDAAGAVWSDAPVTRNHYGSLVLNATRTLFIDVDVDATFHDNQSQSPWSAILSDLQTVLASERKHGFRIYRTAAGFRILATGYQFEPGSRESNRLMSLVGADAKFVELCSVQNSFRARLTPKPWRCGVRRPPNSFPRTSPHEQEEFAEWLTKYDRACADRATCYYMGHIGPRETHEQVRPVIDLHDRETKAFEPLPLA